MDKYVTVEEAVQKHHAMMVFEAGASGLVSVNGLRTATSARTEYRRRQRKQISRAAYDRLTVEEKAANYCEASQNLHKRLPDASNT